MKISCQEIVCGTMGRLRFLKTPPIESDGNNERRRPRTESVEGKWNGLVAMPAKRLQRHSLRFRDRVRRERDDRRYVNETGTTRFHRCIDGRRTAEDAERDTGKCKIGRPSLNQITELEISIGKVTKNLYSPERLQNGFQMPRLCNKHRPRTPDRNQRRPRCGARAQFGGLGLTEMRRKRGYDSLAVEEMRDPIARSFGNQIGDRRDQGREGICIGYAANDASHNFGAAVEGNCC